MEQKKNGEAGPSKPERKGRIYKVVLMAVDWDSSQPGNSPLHWKGINDPILFSAKDDEDAGRKSVKYLKRKKEDLHYDVGDVMKKVGDVKGIPVWREVGVVDRAGWTEYWFGSKRRTKTLN